MYASRRGCRPLRFVAFKLSIEPGFSKIPLTQYRPIGEFENCGCFFEPKPPEKSQFHHLAFAGIQLGKPRQCIVERNQVGRLLWPEYMMLVQCGFNRVVALIGLSRSSGVH